MKPAHPPRGEAFAKANGYTGPLPRRRNITESNVSVHPSLTINEEKTLFMSRNCRRVVTGMTIDPNGTISIGRARKRFIRSLLNDFKHGALIMKQPHILQGNLAFILDVEPRFYDRLCLKYGAELVLKALRQRGDKTD